MNNMTTFKSDTVDRTIFKCSGHGSYCCDDEIEIHADSFFKDCGPEWEYNFTIRFHPSGLWSLLKDWWKWRERTYMDIFVTRKDLEEMRDTIIKELARKNEES